MLQAAWFVGLAGVLLNLPVPLKQSFLTICELLMGLGSTKICDLCILDSYRSDGLSVVLSGNIASHDASSSPAMAYNLEIGNSQNSE